MVVDRYSAQVWASWFRCLGDPSRVLLLNRLAVARRAMTVGELVAAVDIGQPTVSHHLKVLAETGFVQCEPKANTSLYSVNERCLERFPSAAELIMGALPRYEPMDLECLPPWQQDESPPEPGQPKARARRTRRSREHA
jgi:DNA-binding transcriptional ArsR family regulator